MDVKQVINQMSHIIFVSARDERAGSKTVSNSRYSCHGGLDRERDRRLPVEVEILGGLYQQKNSHLNPPTP